MSDPDGTVPDLTAARSSRYRPVATRRSGTARSRRVRPVRVRRAARTTGDHPK
ncbi:MAG: hypothetical protein AVDCRST_MAG41-2155 [uncultured Corynebacteriales bacterium]|uniref:Uncharacterized protein n=1 Tax=uncultured Mycobacteriales bacterium TaxID=581187 RepID=A0A6J4IP12_9ACTN|nr:MAG: hypothetical protein AVDCRST_MAG41-2155 [uncultured Corynebacteriales bacterium]